MGRIKQTQYYQDSYNIVFYLAVIRHLQGG